MSRMEYMTLLLKFSDKLPVRKINGLEQQSYNSQLNFLVEFLSTKEGLIKCESLSENEQKLINKLKQDVNNIHESSNFFFDVDSGRQESQPSPVKPRTNQGVKSAQLNYQ